jgi:hypothetical protein
MRSSAIAGLSCLVLLCGLGPACGSSSGGSGFGSSSGSSGGSSSGSGGSSSSGSGGSSSSSGSLLGDGGMSEGGGCPTPGPGNFDFPGDGCDDDGDGMDNSNAVVCDQTLTAAGSAHDFANAMGICQDVSGQSWGIVSAVYTQGFAMGGTVNDGQHGILPKFGGVLVPKEGSNLGVLSSGFAREWDDIVGAYNNDCSSPTMQTSASCFKGLQVPMSGMASAPNGYPKAATGCPSQMNIAVYDSISVTLQIKVPLNAQGFQFDFDFFSGEWPEYVCTDFNDSFIAWLQSGAFTGNPAGSGDLNISFDAKNNPVSVNNGFFESCTMNTSTGCCAMMGMGPEGCGNPSGMAMCQNGPSELAGTGYQDNGTYCGGASTGGGSTGWLTTKAPAKPGEVITLRFIIWDTGDPNWDSSVLLDHFTWIKGPTMTGTQPAQ